MHPSFQYPPYLGPPLYPHEPRQSSFFVPQYDFHHDQAFLLQMQQEITHPIPPGYAPGAHIPQSLPDTSVNESFRSYPTMSREASRLSSRTRKPLAAKTTSHVPASNASSSSSSAPCAPPRKPKQSGHALWVGNLPPSTKISDLKDHFSLDTTSAVESIFLISRSNCAFVNYRTEAACLTAIEHFHCSIFHGSRISCRLRQKSSFGHVLASGQTDSFQSDTTNESANESTVKPPDLIVTSTPTKIEHDVEQAPNTNGKVDELGIEDFARDKYFIIKSLTLGDVTQSVQSGRWATQPHNEAKLARALEQADDVYLIFSVNKSGEYFGYARITSLILGEGTPNNWPLLVEQYNDDEGDVSSFVTTPATPAAPEGRIFNDSARGTTFWEAVVPSDEERTSRDASLDGPEKNDKIGYEAESKDQQGPSRQFNIRWLSTSPLPFYYTRGLRNLWNANREVKVARDGTEVETSVGRQLVRMFHRQSMSNTMTDERMNFDHGYFSMAQNS